MKEENQTTLQGIFPPPVFVSVLLLMAACLQWYHPLSIATIHREYLLFAGGFLIIVSGVMAFRAGRVMRSRRTPIHFGAPTVAILNQGSFRFTRNPLYLALLMLFAGIGLIANSLWFIPLFVILFLFLHKVILREEKYLEHSFATEYILYKSTVRRWF